jgi:predicted phosphodiesterase
MLFLHVSDIHFCTPDCNDPPNDPEQPFRTALVNDVRTRVSDIGPVDAIIVTGDIAFKGVHDEFEAATNWLKGLANAARCSLDRIYVVPGNHDVDRKIIEHTPAIQNAHQAILSAGVKKIEREFGRQIRDKTTGPTLFEPIYEYNEFAKFFNCQVTPEQLCWRQDIVMEDGVLLRFHGMTSTMLSGAIQRDGGQNDTRDSLYLNPSQTVLDPVPNVVNVALSHHPHDWFMNCDEVEGALNDRANIQFCGHKHKRRLTRDPDYIRLSAGAVNPERHEPGWQPGYNLVKISVVGKMAERCLDFEVTSLEWQSNPGLFKPAVDKKNSPVFRHTISFPWIGTGTPDSVSKPVEPIPEEIVAEVAMSNTSTRNLIRRFWGLTVSQRLEITSEMRLIEAEERALPELRRYTDIFKRAIERNVLDQFVLEVEKREKK